MTSFGDAYSDAHLDLDPLERDADEATARIERLAQNWERILNVAATVTADTAVANQEITTRSDEWRAKLADITVNIVADTGTAIAEISGVEQIADSLDGSVAEIVVNVDAVDAAATLAGVAAAVDGLDGATISIDVNVEGADAAADLTGVAAAVDGLDGAEVTIIADVNAQTTQASEDIDRAVAGWHLAVSGITVDPDVDVTRATADLETATAVWGELLDVVTVNPGFNGSVATAELEAAVGLWNELLQLTATVDVDAAAATVQIATLNAAGERIDGQTLTIDADTDFGSAFAAIEALALAASQLDGTYTIRVDVDTGTSFGTLSALLALVNETTAGTNEIRFDVDPSGRTGSALDRIVDAARTGSVSVSEFGDATKESFLDMENNARGADNAARAAAEAAAKLGELDLTPDFDITGDGVRELADLNDIAAAFPDEINTDATADTSRATGPLQQLQQLITDFRDQTLVLTETVDRPSFIEAAAEVEALSPEDRQIHLGLDMGMLQRNLADATAEFEAANEVWARLTSVSPDVGAADTTAADLSLDEWHARRERLAGILVQVEAAITEAMADLAAVQTVADAVDSNDVEIRATVVGDERAKLVIASLRDALGDLDFDNLLDQTDELGRAIGPLVRSEAQQIEIEVVATGIAETAAELEAVSAAAADQTAVFSVGSDGVVEVIGELTAVNALADDVTKVVDVTARGVTETITEIGAVEAAANDVSMTVGTDTSGLTDVEEAIAQIERTDFWKAFQKTRAGRVALAIGADFDEAGLERLLAQLNEAAGAEDVVADLERSLTRLRSIGVPGGPRVSTPDAAPDGGRSVGTPAAAPNFVDLPFAARRAAVAAAAAQGAADKFFADLDKSPIGKLAKTLNVPRTETELARLGRALKVEGLDDLAADAQEAARRVAQIARGEDGRTQSVFGSFMEDVRTLGRDVKGTGRDLGEVFDTWVEGVRRVHAASRADGGDGSGVVAGVRDEATAVIDAVKQAATSSNTEIDESGERTGNMFSRLFDRINSGFGGVSKKLGETFSGSGLVNRVNGVFERIGLSLSDSIGEVVDGASAVGSELGEAVASGLGEGGEAITSVAGELGESAAATFGEGFEAGAAGLGESLEATLSGAGEAIEAGAAVAGEAAEAAFAGAGEAAEAGFAVAGEAAEATFAVVGEAAEGAASAVGEAFEAGAAVAGEAVETLAGVTGEALEQTAGIAGEVAKGVLATIATGGLNLLGLLATIGPMFLLIASAIAAGITIIGAAVVALGGIITGLIGILAGFAVVAGGLGAAAAAAGVLGIALNKDLLGKVTEGLTDLKNVVAEITRPIGEALIENFLGPFTLVLAKVAEAAAPLALAFVTPIANASLGWLDTFTSVLSSPTALAGITAAGEGIGRLIATFSGYLQPFLEVITRLNGPAFDAFDAFIRLILNMGIAFEPVMKQLFDLVTNLSTVLAPLGARIFAITEQLFVGLNKIVTSKMFTVLLDFFVDAYEGIQLFLKGFVEGFVIASGGAEGFKKNLGGLVAIIKFLVAIAPILGGLLATTFAVAGVAIRAFLTPFKAVADGIFDLLIGLLEMADDVGGIIRNIPGVPDAVKDFVSGAGLMADSLVIVKDTADDTFEGMFDTLSGKDAGDPFGTLNDEARKATELFGDLDGVVDEFGNTLDESGNTIDLNTGKLTENAQAAFDMQQKYRSTSAIYNKLREDFSKPLVVNIDFDSQKLDLAGLIQFNEESTDADGIVTPAKLEVGLFDALEQAQKDAQRSVDKSTYIRGLRLTGLDDLADQIENLDGPTLEAVMAEIGDFAGAGAKRAEEKIDAANKTLLSGTNVFQEGIDDLAEEVQLKLRQAEIVFQLESQGFDGFAEMFAGVAPENLKEAIKSFEAIGIEGVPALEAQLDIIAEAGIQAIAAGDPIGKMWEEARNTPGARAGLLGDLSQLGLSPEQIQAAVNPATRALDPAVEDAIRAAFEDSNMGPAEREAAIQRALNDVINGKTPDVPDPGGFFSIPGNRLGDRLLRQNQQFQQSAAEAAGPVVAAQTAGLDDIENLVNNSAEGLSEEMIKARDRWIALLNGTAENVNNLEAQVVASLLARREANLGQGGQGGKEIGTDIAKGVTASTPEVKTAIDGVIGEAIIHAGELIDSSSKELVAVGSKFQKGFALGISNAVPPYASLAAAIMVVEAIDSTNRMVLAMTPNLKAVGALLVFPLSEGMTLGSTLYVLPTAKQVIQAATAVMLGESFTSITVWLDAGRSLSTVFAAGIAVGLAEADLSKIISEEVARELTAVLPDATNTGIGLGGAIAAGMAQGILLVAPLVIGAARVLAQSVADAMAGTLEVKSPSRVTTNIGFQAARGMAEGIAAGQTAAVTAASDLAREVSAAMTVTAPPVPVTGAFDAFDAGIAGIAKVAGMAGVAGPGSFDASMFGPAGAIPAVTSASGTNQVVVAAPASTQNTGTTINVEHMEVVAPSPEKVPAALFEKVGDEGWKMGLEF